MMIVSYTGTEHPHSWSSYVETNHQYGIKYHPHKFLPFAVQHNRFCLFRHLHNYLLPQLSVGLFWLECIKVI